MDETNYCKVSVQTPSDNNPIRHDLAPYERVVLPREVSEIADQDEIINIIGTRGQKVTKIAGLDKMINLRELILRSCLISEMEGLDNNNALVKLELYDNMIEELVIPPSLAGLIILDISFNAIRDMSPVALCPLLEELYIAQNKLRTIEGVNNLTRIRLLDLGANRIRSMDGLETVTSLQSLWLGKNKIEQITNVHQMIHLKQLDIQNNRLTSLGSDITALTSLKELYLACNAIKTLEGLPASPLSTIDLSSNQLESIEGVDVSACVNTLEELWLTSSALKDFDSLKPLSKLTNLQCLYLEHSPFASLPEYKLHILSLIPNLNQLDAELIH